jgi:cyanophycinase
MSSPSVTAKPRRALNAVLVTVSAVGLVSVAVMVGYLVLVQYEGFSRANSLPPRKPGGALLVCGGGNVPEEIYARFVHLCGGAEGRLIVIPSYEPNAQQITKLIDTWKGRGLGSVEVLHAATREQSNDARFAQPLTNASAVWLTGGVQSWLAETYADTEVERQLQSLLKRGGIIGGTSAGASAMTRVMIAAGRDEAVERRGLDLIPNAVIDQHFLRRNRLQRLLGVLRANPDMIGLGIDEETAVLMERNFSDWTVLGKSYAVICVPSKEQGSRIEILKPGDATNVDRLKERPGMYAIIPSAETDQWLSNPDFYDQSK